MLDGKKTTMLVTAGCAAACAGVSLVPALLAGATLGSGFGAALWGEGGVALTLMTVALAAWAGLTWRDRRSPRTCGCVGGDQAAGDPAGDAVCNLTRPTGQTATGVPISTRNPLRSRP